MKQHNLKNKIIKIDIAKNKHKEKTKLQNYIQGFLLCWQVGTSCHPSLQLEK
jgi:hypothetical protein